MFLTLLFQLVLEAGLYGQVILQREIMCYTFTVTNRSFDTKYKKVDVNTLWEADALKGLIFLSTLHEIIFELFPFYFDCQAKSRNDVLFYFYNEVYLAMTKKNVSCFNHAELVSKKLPF